MYTRYLTNIIQKRIGSGKAILLTGPRQVSKTTLTEAYNAESRLIDRNYFREFVKLAETQ